MFAKCREDGVLNGSLCRQRVLAASPVAEVGPPLKADEACLACKEFTIDATALAHNGTFPLPQGPLPRAIRKLNETTLLGHQCLGTIATDAALEQR